MGEVTGLMAEDFGFFLERDGTRGRFLSRGNVVWHSFKESHSLHTCMSLKCHLLWRMCRQRQGPGNPFLQLPANPRAGFPPVFLPLSHSLYRGEGSHASICLWLKSQSLSKLMMQRNLAGWVNQWALFGNISQETCSLLPSVEGWVIQRWLLPRMACG